VEVTNREIIGCGDKRDNSTPNFFVSMATVRQRYVRESIFAVHRGQIFPLPSIGPAVVSTIKQMYRIH